MAGALQALLLSIQSGASVSKSVVLRDFPGGPVAKTLEFPMLGAWAQSLVRELDPTCLTQLKSSQGATIDSTSPQ